MAQPPIVESGVMTTLIGGPLYIVHGISINIVCDVYDAIFPVTIKWLYNGELDQSKENMSTITVNDANDGDIFTCIIKNELGCDKKDTYIYFIHSHFCI